MERILGFGKFVEISRSRMKVLKTESSHDETRYDVRLHINEQRIEGQIFVDSEGDLECWQLYDADGRCLSETYGHDNIDRLVIKKIKKIRNGRDNK